MSAPQPKCFTLEAPGLLRVLQTDVWMAPLADPKASGPIDFKKYKAIGDTGATNTVLTQKVIDECALKPIGMTLAYVRNRWPLPALCR